MRSRLARRCAVKALLVSAAGIALVCSGARADDGWSNLWLTAPQRAQRLLDSGQPEAAAKLFKDPRRRAYAEIQAGRYAEAARLLEPFTDPRSEYNRGNALAFAGNLKAALAAYDASLAKAPRDADAIHNRDLVARALERESARGSGKGGARGQSGASGRQGRGSESGQKGQQGSSHSGGSQGSNSTGEQAAGAEGSRAGSAGSPESPEQQAAEAREDAELAAQLQRRAAGQGKRSQAGGTGTARGDAKGTNLAGRPTTQGGTEAEGPPLSEQTLALEQWLRRIPDDPGGLLRRKFLIEHLEREQRAQEEASGVAPGGSQP